MKKITLIFLLVSAFVFAQNSPVDFEAIGNGASWTWTVFENDTDPQLEIVSNPSASGINTSATVAKFTALQAGAPFAGVESMHGSDIGTFTLDASNAVVRIMVWKTVISDVGIKFVTASSASNGEIKVSNTVVQQWEELTFDFSSQIGLPASTDIDQIVVFPDFDARTSDNIVYFDSITFSDGSLGLNGNDSLNVTAFPNPVKNVFNVQALEEISEITISNILGQTIQTISPKNKNYSINMSHFETGIYLMKVRSQAQTKTVKVLKD